MWCHVVVLALPVGAHAQEMTAAKAGSLAGFRVSKCRLKRQPRPMSHWNSFARTSNSFNLPNIRPIRRIFSFFLFHFFHVFFWFFSRTSFMSFMFIMSCVHTWLRVPCLQILTHLDSFSESMFHSVCDSLFLFNPR